MMRKTTPIMRFQKWSNFKFEYTSVKNAYSQQQQQQQQYHQRIISKTNIVKIENHEGVGLLDV